MTPAQRKERKQEGEKKPRGKRWEKQKGYKCGPNSTVYCLFEVGQEGEEVE